MLVILSLSYAHAEYTNDELMNMNLKSLRADFTRDTAYSTGAGRIIHDRPNALTLARRTALTEARRGLLILRRELKEGIPRRPDDVSGHVPPVKILSEFESGDIYVVEVETALSELMRNDKETAAVKGGDEDDNEEYEEYEEYDEEDTYDSYNLYDYRTAS